MPTTSRYILELTGTPSVSSTNNSVVNIPGIAGAGSNVAIDLDTLGTSGSGSLAETFHGCLVSNVTAYQGVIPVNDQASCTAAADFIANTCTNVNSNCAITFPVFTTSEGVYSNNSCNIVLANNNIVSTINSYCYDLSNYVQANTNPYVGLASDSCGNACGFQSSNYFLNDNGSNAVNTNIIYSSIADGSVTVPEVPSSDVVFTCGSNSNILFNHNAFNVTLQNSCANHDQSFLLFTPQASATGDQSLGGSTNTDNSINLPFHINNIQSQNGDFYIEPFCDTDGMGRDILVSVLDNTILV